MTMTDSDNNALIINTAVAHKLIIEQFPQWTHLPIKPVKRGGWDNRTFHLGSTMLIRLPSSLAYAPQVQKEQTWLPKLAPYLSFHIPKPIAMGNPSSYYPFHWSIYQWIDGDTVNAEHLNTENAHQLAIQLAQFLQELHSIDTAGGPVPNKNNFYRGGNLAIYDKETRYAIKQLHNSIDRNATLSIWEKATTSIWDKKPLWVHGDLSAENILIHHKKLVAIIDFGCMAIGDPACDLVIAWTLLKNESRNIFKDQICLDSDTWTRARGWALWKALITLASFHDKTQPKAIQQLHIIDNVINE